MTDFPVDPDTLKSLYQNDQISATGLIAIAPIKWLAIHFPELLQTPEQTLQAIAATQVKPNTCKSCVYFSTVHKCCMARIDEDSSYLAVNSQTPACQDFETVDLPDFVKEGGS